MKHKNKSNKKNFFFIEDTDILSLQDKEQIQHNNFVLPFIWSPGSTTEKFPYYSHTLVMRPLYERAQEYNSDSYVDVQSKYFYFYYQLIKKFCKKHSIKFKTVIRANINSTFFFPNYEYIDPHIDFIKEHLVIIIYLNDLNVENSKYSSTIIFDKKMNFITNEDPHVFDLDVYTKKLPIKYEINPKLGKIICFDGAYFHANRFPKPGENRLICIFNLLT